MCNMDNAARERKLERGLYSFLVAYFSLQVLIRVLICGSTLSLDESEQALLSQWLLPGYTAQPPLYAWLQIVFFRSFGLNPAALSLLKNFLLFSTYLLVYLSAKRLLRDGRLAVLSTLSLLLIPQIAWGSQRDLTHTVLVVAVSAATFYVLLGLLESRSTFHYGLLGLILGLGLLSKYSYLIFAVSLLLAVFTTEEGRQVLLDRRVFLSAALALLTASPHLLWLSSHLSATSSSADKLKMGAFSPSDLLEGFGSLASAMVGFLTPLWLVYLILFPAGFKRVRRNPSRGMEAVFLERYFLVLAGLLAAMVLLLQATQFKTRWMQPFLFLFPLYFFMLLKGNQPLREIAYRRFLKIAAVPAIAVLLIMPLRVVGAPLLHYYSYFNYPFDAMAEDIRASGFQKGVIVGNRAFTAGNLHSRFPGSVSFTPDMSALDVSALSEERPLLIVWDTEKSIFLPAELKEFVKERFRVGEEDLSLRRTRYVLAPYKYSRGRYASLGTILLQNGRGRVR